MVAVRANGTSGIEPAALHVAIEAARALAPAMFARVDAALADEAEGGGSARGGILSRLHLGDIGTEVIGAANLAALHL